MHLCSFEADQTLLCDLRGVKPNHGLAVEQLTAVRRRCCRWFCWRCVCVDRCTNANRLGSWVFSSHCDNCWVCVERREGLLVQPANQPCRFCRPPCPCPQVQCWHDGPCIFLRPHFCARVCLEASWRYNTKHEQACYGTTACSPPSLCSL